MNPQLTIKMVAIFLTMVTAVLLSLIVFDALTWDEVSENLGKLLAVSGIVVAATFVVSFIQRVK